MYFKLNFEGKPEIGVYMCLTNYYAIVGKSQTENVLNFLREKINFPIIETTIGGINTVGVLCVGNKNGLLLSSTCNDQELMHIRNSLPPTIRVVRLNNKMNALGNNILCNDHVALVNPDFRDVDLVGEVLGVPVYKMSLGMMSLVGAYGVLNSKGLMVHPEMKEMELKELADLLKVNVISSTTNQGQICVGCGFVANDFMCITGIRSTGVEIKVAETIFGLNDNELDERILKEEVIF